MIALRESGRHILLLVILLFGVVGVVSTYTRMSMTDDEGFHTDFGMEWWKEGTYTKQPLHPPLARVADASLLYVTDVLYHGKGWDGVDKRDAYIDKLILARLGVLPFYILSCFMVFRWARELYGEIPALFSLALYVSLSTVTAHASLATTDMVYVTMLLWALRCSIRWLTQPDRKRSILLGVSVGLMVGSKFSALVHYPAAMLMIVGANAVHNIRQSKPAFSFNRFYILNGLRYCFLYFGFTLLLVYRFQPEALFQGIHDINKLNNISFGVWFYGPFKEGGAWDFFPVVFFYKTPLPFLLALIISHYQLCRDKISKNRLPRLYPLLAACGIMLISMTSHINLGVRHVLAMYPLLAIPSGYVLYSLWQQNVHTRIISALLLVWQCASFANAYPEHIAYFNVLAGDAPEHITLDSDFDWGQDMFLLDEALIENGVDEAYMCARHDTFRNAAIVVHAKILPCPQEQAAGWYAVGRAYMLLNNNIAWLKSYEALQIGNSTMNLYHVPAKEK